LNLPKFTRLKLPEHGPQWREDSTVPLHRQPPSPESLRHDFANLVIRRLTAPEARVAVVEEHGRPALLDCRERLFDLYSKDHPLVGVYKPGARVRDVIDDLKAAVL
jgi:hypothetical protein